MSSPGSEAALRLHGMALAALKRGQPGVALDLLLRACADAGAPGRVHAELAELLRQAGRLSEAEAAARRAVELEPANAPAWNTLGAIQIQLGLLDAGSQSFAVAIQADPNPFKALNNQAVLLQHLGRLGEAKACYHRVLELAPDHAGALLNFAALLGQLGDYDEGLAVVGRVIASDPSQIAAVLLACDMERDRGDDAKALVWIEQALVLQPDQVQALDRRALLHSRRQRWAEALADCDRVLALAPDDPDALNLRAYTLQSLDRVDEALAAFAVARAVSPTPARVLTGEAILLSELGRKSEALATLDQAIALEPRLAEAWYTRANLIRYPADHPDLGAMAALADDPLTPASGRTQLQFALGKAMLDLDQGEEAFRRLGEGARLKRATIEYSPASDARRAELIVSFYTQALLARAPRDETAGERAIFVIGMPRSGTTLIEQILASHPDVHGAGETTYLAAIAEGRDFLDALAQSEPTALADLGRTYLEQLGRGVSPGLRLVDKMPTNFLHAGAIPLILPGARIIHCRRDPLDTCLSCYSLLFTRGQEYSYELGELGHYYRLYRELMAHWRTVLPPQSLLEVDYEALVREPEGEIRRLVEFCALSWDEACLRFYETPRRVTSASLSQVRSPLYASSIGRAQRFRPWLGPLEAAIGASG